MDDDSFAMPVDPGPDLRSVPPPVERPGALALAGLVVAALIVVYLVLKLAGCAFRGGLEYHLRVPQVDGVAEGTDVRCKGVRVGSVEDVDVRGRDLWLTIRVDSDHDGLVREDAKWGFSEVSIGSPKREVLLLDPGGGAAARSGHVFDAEQPSWVSRTWRDVLLAAVAIGLVIKLWTPLLGLVTALLNLFNRG